MARTLKVQRRGVHEPAFLKVVEGGEIKRPEAGDGFLNDILRDTWVLVTW